LSFFACRIAQKSAVQRARINIFYFDWNRPAMTFVVVLFSDFLARSIGSMEFPIPLNYRSRQRLQAF